MAKRTVAPTVEPVLLVDVKRNSYVDHEEDDPLIEGSIIPAAREHIEDLGQFATMVGTWRQILNGFPVGPIRLERPPLLDVTSLEHLDTAGSWQTVSSSLYRVMADTRPGLILPAAGHDWPSGLADGEATVRVTFRAGVASRNDVPAVIRRAIVMLASYWYEQREAFVAGTVDRAIALSLEGMLATSGYQVRYA